MFHDVRDFVELRGGAAAEVSSLRTWDSSSVGFLYAPDRLWSAQTGSTLAAGAASPQEVVLNAMATTGPYQSTPYQSTRVLSDWLDPSCESEDPSHSHPGNWSQEVPWSRCG